MIPVDCVVAGYGNGLSNESGVAVRVLDYDLSVVPIDVAIILAHVVSDGRLMPIMLGLLSRTSGVVSLPGLLLHISLVLFDSDIEWSASLTYVALVTTATWNLIHNS